MADLTSNGVRHHVQRLGEGRQTIVFVHGLVMDNLASWYFTVANPVARLAEALLYDLRGHGRSERPETGYDLDTLVSDLSGLLDAAEVDRPVTLVGNSFGGLLSLAFALRHPDRVSSLVLVDALIPEAGWGEAMATTLGLDGERRNEMIARTFQSWLGRQSERKRSKLAKGADALVKGTTLLEDLVRSPHVEDEAYASIEAPVLALYGEHSDMLDRGERLAANLSDCTFETLKGCTHSVLWEATDTLRERIVDWVRR